MHIDARDKLKYILAMNTQNFTVIFEQEDDGYVSLCPELDIASEGDSLDEARKNLKEAIELFYETASKNEIASRIHKNVLIGQLEVTVG